MHRNNPIVTKVINGLVRLWPQWLTSLIVILLCISIGLGMGWSSPYLARLSGNNPPFFVTDYQLSWIASLLPLGRLVGAIFGSLFVEYFGSKMSLFVTGLPLVVAWICVIAADSISWLYVFRIFTGISMGMLFSCYPLYIGEISPPSIRGALIVLIINGLPLGSLFGNIMGPYLKMNYYGIISLIVTLLYTCSFPFLPHSPYYFVQQEDMKRAEKAIQWYHRKVDVTVELDAIERFVRLTNQMTLKERLKRLKEPIHYRAFMIVIPLFMFMQLSGMGVIMFYMEIILREALITSIAPSSYVMIVNAIGIIIGWCAAYVIDRYGRRLLLLISMIGVTIGLLLLGLHFFILNYDYDASNIEWLAIGSLLIFMSICFGLVPVPNTMLSELFTTDMKSLAGLACSSTLALFSFIVLITYHPLKQLGNAYVFWMYAILTIIGLIYAIIFIPETKEKTLQEIQELMAEHTRTRDSRWVNRAQDATAN